MDKIITDGLSAPILGLLSLFFLPFISNAHDTFPHDKYPEPVQSLCEANSSACRIQSRLYAFRPNYVIWQQTDKDDDALEVRFSFRYLFTRPHCMSGHDFIEYSLAETIQCIKQYNERWEAYFSYTGEFDFYMGTRDSGPVINRVSNPGFHYRQQISDSIFRYYDLGLEHRSNGQVTEIDERDGANLKTQIAYDNEDYEYFDGISRGANYWIIESKLQFSESSRLWVNAKIYINDDSNVNWGPDALENPSIEDYDRVRLIYEHRWKEVGRNNNKDAEFSFEWVIGDEGAKTDSFNIDFMYPLVVGSYHFPAFIRLHSGPLSTLSNYTLEQDSVGIGFKLRAF